MDAFMGRARQAAAREVFGPSSMREATRTILYAVWDQGSGEVSTLVKNDAMFESCIALMKRKWKDRFRLGYRVGESPMMVD